ncbi:DUF4199 domain-containing protein [Ferruginibacter sp. SUN106]|uniref:DUF4199 domain-containing protein n=1 Tax=Ferruginibacter sp. SUN106 TaxID=2978348 RepID=UPI003D367EC8
MKKLVIVYGIIAGLIVTGMMAFSTGYYCAKGDFEGGMIYGYSAMIIAFSMIFVAIKSFRDKHNGGTISFGKAFKTGLFVSLIASTIYVAGWLINYYFFIPDFMDKYAAAMIAKAKSSGMSAGDLAKKTADMAQMKEWYKNPLFVILMTYAEILPVAIVVTLISALVLKRTTPKQIPTT